ncbi:MAG TPA: aldehyde ferredoxin oxidoreductase family protein [Rectinemataceae bacterium]|nr:aldehyde ferredoxin oxidoreductase family protein [Rectinemataceae bacterium]
MDIAYGKTLIVDLSSGTSKTEILDERPLRSFIGGSGVAAWLFSRHAPAGVGPLDPANPLIFALGPLCGTPAPTSGRHEVAALSPLTGLFAESDVGGAWGSVFRNTGFDFLVISGASGKPVTLVVTETGGRVEDAAAVWGRDTFDTYDHYSQKYPGSETACIGVAGERMVSIACVAHDGRDARMAGRCGLGAVMGSKKLKAVVAAPASKAPRAIHDAAALKEVAREVARNMATATEAMGKFGTAGSLGGFYEMGDVPVKNWSLGVADIDIASISGQRMAESGRLKKRFFCTMCPIGCGRVVQLSDGSLGGGPEYETLSLLGANCMIDDIEAIMTANEKANRYGIDTISAGSAIAFLMEAYEKGHIRGQDLSGVVPAWGSGTALVELIDLIGAKKGIGALLGEGVASASHKLGSPDYAVHVKGLEFPGHDPRAFNSMALSYATANRGACHLQGMTYGYERRLTFPELGFDSPQDRFGKERKPELVIASQNFMSLMDSLKLCKFSIGGGNSATQALDWLKFATGWDMGLEEFLRAGERIFNLKRLYNVSRGISRKDDHLPKRILTEPKGGGAGQNLPSDFEASLDRYYALRGWTGDGIPTEAKLKELDLSGFA